MRPDFARAADLGVTTAAIGETLRIATVGDYDVALPKLNLASRQTALASFAVIDAASERISKELSSIGAIQSRLSVAENTLQSSRENFDAASSRITDVDMAEESANYVRTQILQQSCTAVLSQANQQPELALKLLNGV